MEDEQAPDGRGNEHDASRVAVGQVVAGAVVGFIATWAVFTVALLTLYAQFGDSSGLWQNVLAGAGLLGLPILFGALLIRERTRRWGAGLVMGLAIGSITGAGICGGFLGLNAL